jgi:threonine synthase
MAHEAGQVPVGATVVCTVTGHGLKDPQWALRTPDGGEVTPVRIPVDAFSAAQALGLES